jgi:hypothetical protein
MVHLLPLPGAPRFDAEGGRERIRSRALADARALVAGGCDAVLVENFGDVPFSPETVPPHVVASMTDLVGRVVEAVDCPVGVNVLRNDAEAAVSVASATDASFVRVNVHAGARVTDQGVVEGRAHETMRLRTRLGSDVAVLADDDVKHSAPLGARRSLDESVDDVVTRGLADGVVVSGKGTGHAVDTDRLASIAAACERHDAPLFVGSGVTADSVAHCLTHADGVVVGTALKVDGETTNPVDVERVRAVVDAAQESV